MKKIDSTYTEISENEGVIRVRASDAEAPARPVILYTADVAIKEDNRYVCTKDDRHLFTATDVWAVAHLLEDHIRFVFNELKDHHAEDPDFYEDIGCMNSLTEFANNRGLEYSDIAEMVKCL